MITQNRNFMEQCFFTNNREIHNSNFKIELFQLSTCQCLTLNTNKSDKSKDVNRIYIWGHLLGNFKYNYYNHIRIELSHPISFH